MIGGLLRGVASIVGAVTGTVIGVASVVVSEALGITVAMVDKAKEAGCETYEEIKEYWKKRT